MSLKEDFLLTAPHEVSGFRVKLSYQKTKSLIHLVSIIEQGTQSGSSSWRTVPTPPDTGS